MDPFEHVLVVDFETASVLDLRQVGAWTYSKHPSTIVYCAVFASSEDTTIYRWANRGGTLHPEVIAFLRGGGTLIAHNVSFEISIWTNIMVPRYGWPRVDLHQWRCTQAIGHSLNLPSTLDGLAAALGTKHRKDKVGADLMQKMAKAVERPQRRYSYPHATRENVDRLMQYCARDVKVTRLCYDELAPLSMREQCIWQVDMKTNLRGVHIDTDFARRCLRLTRERQRQLDLEVFDMTKAEVLRAADPNAMRDWLGGLGVSLPRRRRANGTISESVDAQAVAELLETDLPPIVRAVLENRREAAFATSLAKLQRALMMVDPADDRVRWALRYNTAHTGRWSSAGIQVHNLPKIKLSPADLELARTIVTHGDIETLVFCFPRVLYVLSQLLRSVISAPPGFELIAGDFAAIEARIIAWLAEQNDIVDLFRTGQDVYTHVATRLGSQDRQLGKVCQLALGYGMGAIKFADTAARWGVDLELRRAADLTVKWRAANWQIATFWSNLEAAAFAAVAGGMKRPSPVISVGRIQLRGTPQCLMIQLPSGRVLRYWRPSIARTTKTVQVVGDDGKPTTIEITGDEIRFFQVGKDKSQMVQESTYGGKLAENVTQAVARDLLAEALLRLERTQRYLPIIHVHDSAACEVPAGTGSVEEFCWHASERPDWADGLPIAVEGYRDTRFRG